MELVNRQISKDGTIKYAFEVPVTQNLVSSFPRRKEKIEATFLEIPDRDDSKPKYVLCLSSMVGCMFQCGHCANQFNGFFRVLTPNEINEQIKLVLEQDGNLGKVREEGVVEHAFMGMGEPLYCNNVIKAIQNHKPFVQDTRFTISTIGAKRYIDKLTRENFPFQVRLNLSLHFPTDETRRQWIHPNTLSTYRPELTISRALDDAARFMAKHPGKVALNYALIDRLNNSEQDAQEIAKILKGRKGFYIKVMEVNQTSALTGSWRNERGAFGLDFDKRGPFYETPEEFRDALKKYGVEAKTFRSRGKDIDAACGKIALR